MNRPILFDRRRFVTLLASLGGLTATNSLFGRKATALAAQAVGATDPANRTLARYPQKTDLILLTDRPPQLETPLHYFQSDLTPKEAFFVRWHFSGIPTAVDLQTFRLEVAGRVQTPLTLSRRDLQTRFEPSSFVALNQCSGNSRSLFEPRVPGGQ